MLRHRPWRLLLITVVLGLTSPTSRADDWLQWLGPKRDGIWRETGLAETFPDGGPKVRWRTPIGEGYAGPAVANGKVYITDRVLAQGSKNPANAFDRKTRVGGRERVLCLDETTGKILWEHAHDRAYQISYASGPRTTPVVAGGKVYTVGAMGDLLCLDADTGKVVWTKYFPDDYNADPPMWGFAGHPLLDGDRLICLVGGPGSVVVAFHKDTGKELWKALSAKEPGYAPPVIFDIGGTRQLILWHPESVNALNPETGKVYWTQPYGERKYIKAGMTIPTPRYTADGLLYLTNFYDGSLMLKTNGTQKPSILWQGRGRSEQPDDTVALHCVMSTPFVVGGHIYGVDSYGELRGLVRDTGERLWSTHQPTTGKSVRWGHAFLVQMGDEKSDRFVLFNEGGDLILARLTPKGYTETGRAHILEPTNTMAPPAGRRVIWSHPAFANRHVVARNDREIISVSLEK